MIVALSSGRKIGDGEPPFIIAEVGSNWRTIDDCLHSIVMAKACGADAVKFQLFTNEALYGPHTSLIYERKGHLDPAWIPKLKAKADACGIEFMCSTFSPELYDAVNPYVNTHKIASAELSHVRILEKVLSFGKPVILSTGASGKRDIEMAINVLKGVPVVLMYCVAAYPARDIRLGMINSLREFGTLTGYSDHSTDINVVPSAAIQAGACVLEKHVNFTDHSDTPDAPHSLSTDEFKRMVQAIRGEAIASWGSPEEQAMIIRHNRRLIATRDIKPGETLEENKNFGIYRSLKDDTKALSPFAIGQVHGRIAKGAINAGDGIGPSDLE